MNSLLENILNVCGGQNTPIDRILFIYQKNETDTLQKTFLSRVAKSLTAYDSIKY